MGVFDEAEAEFKQSKRSVFDDAEAELNLTSSPKAVPMKRGGNALLGTAAMIANKIDSYTGAPLRGGISAMQDESESANPSFARLPAAFARGAFRGFGNEQTQSGKQIFERAGYSGEGLPMAYPNYDPKMGEMGKGPSPAGILGFILDLATPVPGLAEAKAAGLGMKMTAKGTAKAGVEAAAKTANAAANTADVLTGSQVASKTLRGAKASLKGLGQGMESLTNALRVRYGSRLAPDAEKSIQTAAKNGIDPKTLNEAILFGPETSASRQARALGESPMGQHIRERNAKLSQDVQDAIRADIRRIGGETKDASGKVVKEAVIPANAFEAGDLVKSAYDDKVEKTLGEMDVTYQSLAKQAPDAKIPPSAMGRLKGHLSALEKYATDLGTDAFDDVTESQAKHLLKTIEKVRNAGDNLGSVTRGMQGLGRTAFKVKTPLGQIPPDLSKIRQLYGQLSEAVTDGAGAHFGKETADKLRANNKAISELYGDKTLIPSLGDAAKSEDKLFRSLVLDGDAKRIGTLKKYLSPDELNRVKAATLDLLNKENIQGEFTFRNNLSQRLANKTDALNALFNRGELDNIQDLFRLGDKIGPSVLSTSGTGSSLAHQAASWGDWVSPGKVLDKAERGADKVAAARQKAAASKAIDLETQTPMRDPTLGPQMPPTLGLVPQTMRGLLNGGPAFRKKGLQMYGSQNSHPQDQEAMDWAKANPDDPRSALILKANGL